MERRENALSEDQIERIAQRAADIVWENFQREVGKGTLKLLIYVVGAAGLAILSWLGLQGQVGH